ncbi:MAG: carbon-nitrogen hydrolase family protein [Clostridia bacterium]|nr:carbon-nitrogen hydrolase family protein [Clostridia bacterium]
MSKPCKVALIQFESKLLDIDHNLEHALDLARQASESGANLICLPETFVTGYNLDVFGNDIGSLAQESGEKVLTALKEFAKEHHVYMMASVAYWHTKPDKCEEKKPNISAFFIDDTGSLMGIYDKNHLFGDEKLYFSKGTSYPVFDTPFGRIGIMLCYDANFPEPARILALQGAQIILCPAAWRVQDIRLFDMIMPQRAAENVCYVCAVNRFGDDAGRYNPGHSMVCTPDGKLQAFLGEAEGIVYADIDSDITDALRQEIPYLDDLRYDEYLPYLKGCFPPKL